MYEVKRPVGRFCGADQLRSDRNTAEIVSALRAAGCFVVYLDPDGSSWGAGTPDLMVASKASGKPATTLLEVKTPRGRTRPSQTDWHARWAAAGGCPVVIVRTVDDALAAVGLLAGTSITTGAAT